MHSHDSIDFKHDNFTVRKFFQWNVQCCMWSCKDDITVQVSLCAGIVKRMIINTEKY